MCGGGGGGAEGVALGRGRGVGWGGAAGVVVWGWDGVRQRGGIGKGAEGWDWEGGRGVGLGRGQRGGIGKGAGVSGVHTHVHWDRKICGGSGGGIWRRAFRLWFRVRGMEVMGGSTTTYPPASHLVKEPHIVAHSHQGVG